MRRINVCWLGALFSIFLPSLACAQPAPLAKTQFGTVRGVGEDGISTFKGIPFAAAPIGPLRWQAPEQPAAWQGVRDATAFAPACPQTGMHGQNKGGLRTSEDCLYVNVWTPAKTASARLPVLVWIYGGGFTQGATSIPTYSGRHLAQKGVVVVSIAYRVGPFGFLAHPELTAQSQHHSSGDYGLLDQIAGLEWVKHNIAAFGGNPDQVTIFGESAGGISVSMLCASPLAKGLFEGAISESGGSFGPPRTKDEGGTNVPPLSLAEQKGVKFLRALHVNSIAAARKLSTAQILAKAGPALGGRLFWPVFDGYVLPGEQYSLYAAGHYNDVPVLIGTNTDEGALFPQAPDAKSYIPNVREAFGPFAGRILKAYPANDNRQALRSGRDLFRDTGFVWPTWTWARLQARTGRSAVYVYYFGLRPPYPDEPRYADWGASHGAEVAYVFGNLDAGKMKWRPIDRTVSERLMDYWTNFAKTGNPNGDGLAYWPAFKPPHPKVMFFNKADAITPVPNRKRLHLLDTYFAWRRDHPQRPYTLSGAR
ncbi:MAG: carboxylesterase family protein [Alphaproteobacteria bacterium]|nr:carboxylesterase family protein [Alphaproteobacteria bacterium]